MALCSHTEGKPIYTFEPLLSARFVAAFRLIIALIYMVAIWADPLQPVRYAEIGHALLAAYLLWASVIVWTANRNWWVEFHLARPALLIDVFVGLGSIFFTEGASQDFATPLAAFFLFILVESIFIGGWRNALRVGVFFIAGLVLVAIAMSFHGEPIDSVPVARRVGFFFLITALAVWFGGRRTTVSVPSFSAGLGSKVGPPMKEALAYACDIFGTTAGIAVWQSDGQPSACLEMRGDSAQLSWPVAPSSIEELGNITLAPALFRIDRDLALKLDGAERVVPFRRDMTVEDGLLPETGDAISIPIKATNIRAVIIPVGLRAAGRDLLPKAQAVAREVCTALDRHSLSVLAIEDRMGAVRQSVARDLHDSVAQSLAGAVFRIEAARNGLHEGLDAQVELLAVHDALQSEQRHVRTIIERLRKGGDPRLRHDLAGDLVEVLDELGKQWRLELDFAQPTEAIEIGSSQLHEIRQIVREAVANSALHGNSTRVTFKLSAEAQAIQLDIVDNGLGRPAAASNKPFQPRSISERVAALGGKLDARQGPSGTRLYITIPRLSA